MRISIVSLFLLLFINFISAVAQDILAHKVNAVSSHFVIEGRTNVNSFSCELEQRDVSDTLEVRRFWSDFRMTFEGLELGYPVAAFDCGLDLMTQDLQATLNADEYPTLYLKIKDISIARESAEIERLDVIAHATITIAGVAKDILVENGKVINLTENSLIFSGNKQLNMTDFGIEPPSRMMGFVKVKNELAISFSIQLIAKPIH